MTVPFTVEHLSETGSTNDDLKRRAAEGAPEGLVLTAERQTAGRGRLGRSFFSPPECGLYASVLLRPQIVLADVNLITCFAAVVLHRVIGSIADGTVGIKWVNDIYRNGKKVCGVLTEAASHADGTAAHVIVGFGINIIPPPGGFPADIAGIAGSVLDGCADTTAVKTDILRRVLAGLGEYREAMSDMRFMEEYCAASILRNTPVRVCRGESIRDATAICVEPNGQLSVQYDDGTKESLLAGDVSIRLDK